MMLAQGWLTPDDKYVVLRSLPNDDCAVAHEASVQDRDAHVWLEALEPDPIQSDRPRLEELEAIEASRALHHPRLAPLLDTGIGEGNTVFVTRPLPPGQSAVDWRSARTQIPVATACAIGAALAEALGEAHARGVVHGAIAPEWIRFGEGDPPDSLLLYGLGTATLGPTPKTVGRPPELLAGHRPDQSSDVWGVAATVTWLLLGTALGRAGEPLTWPAMVPASLRELLETNLSPDRSRRSPSVRALAVELTIQYGRLTQAALTAPIAQRSPIPALMPASGEDGPDSGAVPGRAETPIPKAPGLPRVPGPKPPASVALPLGSNSLSEELRVAPTSATRALWLSLAVGIGAGLLLAWLANQL